MGNSQSDQNKEKEIQNQNNIPKIEQNQQIQQQVQIPQQVIQTPSQQQQQQPIEQQSQKAQQQETQETFNTYHQQFLKHYKSSLDTEREKFLNREDPIEEQAKVIKNLDSQEKNISINDYVDFQLMTNQSTFKISTEKEQIVPVMISVSTKTIKDDKRAPIDIVCVIDDSGSMQGMKAKLVRKSLKYIMKILNEDDRVCLIAFDSRATILTPFLKNNLANKAEIKKAISFINGKSSTDIPAGVENALWMLQNRKQQNSISCIFLLSDGQNNKSRYAPQIDQIIKISSKEEQPEITIENLIQMYKKDKFGNDMKYIINCYGYGQDHDADLMSKIATENNGGFYFVQEFSQISDWFVLSLSGLLSVIGEQVEIMVKGAKGYEISQRYGGAKVWNNDNNVFIPHLVQGCQKEYFLEFVIPKSKGMVSDNERNLTVLTAELRGTFVKGDKNFFSISSKLNLQFCNPDEKLEENSNLSQDLLQKFEVAYLRSKGGVVIGQARELAKQRQFEQAQNLLSEFDQEIGKAQFQQASGFKYIQRDIIQCRNLCKESVFEQEGKAFMYKKELDHFKRQMSICCLQDMDDNQREIFEDYNNGGKQLSDDSCEHQVDYKQKNVIIMQRQNSRILQRQNSGSLQNPEDEDLQNFIFSSIILKQNSQQRQEGSQIDLDQLKQEGSQIDLDEDDFLDDIAQEETIKQITIQDPKLNFKNTTNNN